MCPWLARLFWLFQPFLRSRRLQWRSRTKTGDVLISGAGMVGCYPTPPWDGWKPIFWDDKSSVFRCKSTYQLVDFATTVLRWPEKAKICSWMIGVEISTVAGWYDIYIYPVWTGLNIMAHCLTWKLDTNAIRCIFFNCVVLFCYIPVVGKLWRGMFCDVDLGVMLICSRRFT